MYKMDAFGDSIDTPQRTIPRGPSFFVVGAPRCGTTAVYSYLRKHPAIFMPDRKEPHFFATDLPDQHQVQSTEDYRALFTGAPAESLVGEASVYYLASQDAPARIRDFCPSARIVAMIRNPIEQMYSNHRKNLEISIENVPDFEEVLRLEPIRKRGEQLPPWVTLDNGAYKLFYRQTATYSPQLRRYFETFGRNRVHVILYDDFANDPATVYRDVCRFLGLSPDDSLEFGVVNANVEMRSKWLSDVLREPPKPFRSLARAVLPSSARARLFQMAFRFNFPQRSRQPLSPTLTRRLADEFRDEVQQLGDLLDRDLSHWLQTDGLSA